MDFALTMDSGLTMGFDQLAAAASRAGMNPLEYAHMVTRSNFIDEDSERRVFNPLWLRVSPATLENLTAYDSRAGITHTRFGVMLEREPRVDKHALVVRVCGTPGAGAADEAAIGVYFGPDSPHNFAARVPARLSQASKFMEIFAVRMALVRIRDHWRNDHTISTVHIVTDSEYVVQALSEDIEAWRADGFQNAQGEKDVDSLEIEKLDLLMLELAEDGVDVSFWPVNRTENEEAYRLARGVFGH